MQHTTSHDHCLNEYFLFIHCTHMKEMSFKCPIVKKKKNKAAGEIVTPKKYGFHPSWKKFLCRTDIDFSVQFMRTTNACSPQMLSEIMVFFNTLQWRHNERDGVSNHQPHDCLLNRLFKAQNKENIKAPRHWPLCGEITDGRWIPCTKGQ